MKNHFSIEEAKSRLQQQSLNTYITLLQHGTLAVEYFAPKNVDTQTPHAQDELYIITSGHAQFFREGEIVECKTGDLLFVPAGMEHRFQNFSNDFATWVIFYGAMGGETIL